MIKSKQDQSHFPLTLAFQRADLCEKVSDSAHQLSGVCEHIMRLYRKLGKITNTDLESHVARIAGLKQDLDDLKIQALRTGATITIQIKTLDEWMNKAREGSILDVFTDEGLKTMSDRLEKANLNIKSAVDELGNFTTSGLIPSEK